MEEMSYREMDDSPKAWGIRKGLQVWIGEFYGSEAYFEYSWMILNPEIPMMEHECEDYCVHQYSFWHEGFEGAKVV